MIYTEIRLDDFFPMLEGGATLTVYSRSNSPEIDMTRRYPAVIVCPGGGYSMVSDRENEPVALALVGAGFTAMTLKYSVAPVRYPTQLLQAGAAMALARQNADKWNIDPDKIAVMGFSAGGHLAANLGTGWNSGLWKSVLNLEPQNVRPQALVLCYPFISTSTFAHRGSLEVLLGSNPEPGLEKKLSLENAVDSDTAPAFLWHTADDDVVPVENSMLMAAALKKAGVSFELHIFQSGAHGLSLCDERTAQPQNTGLINPPAGAWFELAVGWLKRIMNA